MLIFTYVPYAMYTYCAKVEKFQTWLHPMQLSSLLLLRISRRILTSLVWRGRPEIWRRNWVASCVVAVVIGKDVRVSVTLLTCEATNELCI